MNTEFGKMLRRFRDLSDLSQAELQDRLDTQGYYFTKSAISKWENGLHVPRAEVVEVLEDILMPQSVGLLLKAAGYHAEAEIRFQSIGIVREEQSSHSKELTTTALVIASNLEKYRNEPAAFLGDITSPFIGDSRHTVGERVYGGWWIGEGRAKLGDVDKNAAANLLTQLKDEGEFPELADIKDWPELNDTKITENFIQRLISRAHRGNF